MKSEVIQDKFEDQEQERGRNKVKRPLGESAMQNALLVQPNQSKVNLVPDNGEYSADTAKPIRPLVIPNYPA